MSAINEELIQIYKAGKDGWDWYKNAKGVMRHLVDDAKDTDMMCWLVAATSPRQSLKGNITLAVRAYKDFKQHGKLVSQGFLPNVVANVERVFEDKAISGPKVFAFGRALVKEGHTDACPVDLWMLRMFDYPHWTERRQAVIENTLRAVSDSCMPGLKLAQFQAALWTGYRRLYGNPAHDFFSEVIPDVEG